MSAVDVKSAVTTTAPATTSKDDAESKRDTVLNEIIGLYTGAGSGGESTYFGESISQCSHALQSAYMASRAFPADDEVIVAALLHDIGHLWGAKAKLPVMGSYGVVGHERIGAEQLRAWGMAERVCKLVGSHVAAKRYLCARQSDYHAKLSAASAETLKLQGGVMSAKEADDFDTEPDRAVILLMRSWDEKAKIVDWKGPDFDSYVPRIRKLIHPTAAPTTAIAASAIASTSSAK